RPERAGGGADDRYHLCRACLGARQSRNYYSVMAADEHERTEQPDTAVAPPSALRASASPLVRRLLAGLLSGASGLIAVLLLLALLLVIGAIWPLLFDISSGLRGKLPFWQTVGQAMAESLGNLPVFLWSARWGILGMALLGLLLAFIDS